VKVAIPFVVAVVAVLLTPSPSLSDWIFEVTEGNLDDHEGYVMTVEHPGEIFERYFYIQEPETIWLYAVQPDTAGGWIVQDPAYARRPRVLTVGQEWLSGDVDSIVVNRVIDGGDLSTPAGDFVSYRVEQFEQDDPDSTILKYEWFTNEVGLVAADEIGDQKIVLVEYDIEGGSDFFPLHEGNRWFFLEVDAVDYVVPTLKRSWGRIKSSFAK
jgi:hypothetical protein